MNTFKLRFLSACLLACLLLTTLPVSYVHARDAIIYVDQDAVGLNNGTSWQNAYVDLQSALTAAGSGDHIYVAEGTYTPVPPAVLKRWASFELKDDVNLYGGFVGMELSPNQRDLGAHATILSGDIGLSGVSTDNSYHVVAANTSGGARLDGFVIADGKANGAAPDNNGGGLLRRGGVGATLILDHVVFRENAASGIGGGIYNEDGGLSLNQVTFENNTAKRGGGAYNKGYAMFTSATFAGNSAGGGGGIFSSGQTGVINSTFYGNHATDIAGGGIYNSGSILNISYSTFSHNEAADEGVDLYSSGAKLTLRNNILANSPRGADCYLAAGLHVPGDLVIDHNLIESNARGVNACGTPLLTADPKLGSLQNNGGFTQTMALRTGSKAIDAADDATCPDTDQRGWGVMRPQSRHCDLGAYEVQTAPGKAVLVSPDGISSRTPTFTWNPANATWYYLQVDGPSGNVLGQWYSAEQASCDDSTCSLTPLGLNLVGGAYTWQVQTRNETGDGPWSDPLSFEVPLPPLPGEATLVSPTIAAETRTPTYTWNEGSDATQYYLWVDGPSGNVFEGWYEASAICMWGSCSVTPAVTLADGDYTWRVQTRNETGDGPWSDSMTFNVALPGKATLIQPMGFSLPPHTFVWNEVPGASHYYLEINTSAGANVFVRWYEASALCSGGFCQVTPSTPLSAGVSYTWRIQTWNELGYGPWSDPLSFTVFGLVPVK